MRYRVFEVIEKARDNDMYSKMCDLFLLTLITLNIGAIVLESFKDIYIQYQHDFKSFEIFSIIVFSIEYILRLWTAKYLYPDSKHPYIKYIKSPLAIIDLITILPFFLPLLIKIDLRVLKFFKFIRFIKLFKYNRYTKSFSLIIVVIKKQRDILITSIALSGFVILLSSALMYYIENAIQPEAFPNILQTMWWAVATLTTVGYGDVYPVSTLGKILASVVAISSIGIVALPASILSGGFIAEISKKETVQEDNNKEIVYVCGSCGTEMIKNKEKGEIKNVSRKN